MRSAPGGRRGGVDHTGRTPGDEGMTLAETRVERGRHQRFRFRTADALRSAAVQLGVELPWLGDTRGLLEPVRVGDAVSPNRLAIQPMEGLDANEDGSPGEATRARYEGYAR